MIKLKIVQKICILILLFSISIPLYAQEDVAGKKNFCMVYFSGIGCSSCKKSDPPLFNILLKEQPSVIIVEFEMNRERKNAAMIAVYNSNYGSGMGIPLLIFSKEESMSGDQQILMAIAGRIFDFNGLPLPDGSSRGFNAADITALGGRPKIWRDGRILICKGEKGNSDLLKELLLSDELPAVLEKAGFEKVEPEPVLISHGRVEFENAIKIDDWIFQWDRKKEAKTFLFYPEDRHEDRHNGHGHR